MRKLIVTGASLSLSVGMLLAMCQYATPTLTEGTTADCTSACVADAYLPAVMRCKNTCDTLRCFASGWAYTTRYRSIGTCSGNTCINVILYVDYDCPVQEFSSDDGCLTPCGG